MADPTPAERLAHLHDPATETVALARDGNLIIGEARMPDGRKLDFEARNIRNERTGVHARLEISLEGHPLVFSVLNIERDEDRTRLSGSAGDRAGDRQALREVIKRRLDEFCAGVWPTWVSGDTGWWEGGEDRRTSWLLEPWLLEGAGTILYGPPSAAKSWLTMLWALGINHGQGPWPTVKTGPTLLVNLERPAPLVRVRIRETARAIGCHERLLTLHARGRSLSDVAAAIGQTVTREGVAAVVVDSLSRSGTGDLTANDAANRAMDVLNGLGCAWCVIAHTPRADGSHVYGSVMFEAAADLCVRVSATQLETDQGSRIGVKLETTKANDVRKGRPEIWALDFGHGDDGLLGFRRADPGEFVDLEVGALTIEDKIADVLTAGASTTREIAEELAMSIDVVGATCRRSKRFVRLQTGQGGGRGRSGSWGLRSDES